MQTESIAVEVRPRAGFEAVDLGFRFARAIFWPLFPAHAIVVAAVACALYGGLASRLWLAGLLVWWLKPLYDRVALAVLAEALFGRVPTLFETVASVPRLITTTGLFQSLTFLRFSPLRASTAPVLQLEGLRGIERSRRVSVLVGRDSRAALGLFFACSTFELVIFAAGLQLAATLRPEGEMGAFWQGALSGGGPELSFIEAGLYALAIAAIEPLYVAGGFALYVNRRVWLEGWDVDLAFRRLEQRARAPRARSRLARGAPLGFLLFALLLPAAASADCGTPGPGGAKPCIDAVLEEPEFSTIEKVELWLPKESPAEANAEPGVFSRLVLWVGSVGATLLRIAAWLALALVVAALAIVIARSLRARERGTRQDVADEPAVRFGLDLRPEALPPDVVAAAHARFAAGDAPGALSLLYRGARAALDAGLASDFALLTRAWIFCAYAHQAPAPEAFAELCQRWRPHLGASS